MVNYSQTLKFIQRDRQILTVSNRWAMSHLQSGGDLRFGTLQQVSEKTAFILTGKLSKWNSYISSRIVENCLKSGSWISSEHGYHKHLIQIYYAPHLKPLPHQQF